MARPTHDMATNKLTATVQATATDSDVLATQAKAKEVAAKEAAKAALLAELSVGELVSALAEQTRFSDVLRAADPLTDPVKELATKETKASRIAARLSLTHPSKVFAFRVTLAAYSLAKAKRGEKVTTQQHAELESKLAPLAESGKMTDRKLSFGHIVLPQMVGEA